MIGDKGTKADNSPPLPQSPRQTLRVLLAEDDEVSRDIVGLILGQRGHSVTATADGHQALTAWEAGPDDYDVLLTDIMMPEMDGIDLAKAIRQQEADRERRLPIVALTANVAEDDLQRYWNAGIDDCVAKPIDRVQLLGAMEEAYEGRKATVRRKDLASSKALVCDTTRLLVEYGRDIDFIQQLLESFGRVFREDATRLRDAIAQGDVATARKAAHRVKGSVGNLHGHALRATAETIEKCAAANDMAPLPKLLVQLEAQFVEFDQVLRTIVEESNGAR